MRSGNKTALVTIQQATETRDSVTNEKGLSWGTFRQAWGSVEARKGREFLENGKRDKETLYRFVFDYLDADGVTEAMRVSWNGQIFDITFVQADFVMKTEIVVETKLSRTGATR